MKKLIMILLVILSIAVVACTAPASDLETAKVVEDQEQEAQKVEGDPVLTERYIDTQKSTFAFEGYTAVKSHIGTFDDWSGSMIYDVAGNPVTGSVIIAATSVNTGISGLDDHLKNDDFFEVEVHPEIVVVFLEMNADSILSEITFRDITKIVSIPATVAGEEIKADFLLDTTDFNMKHAGVNKEVRIEFNVVLTE